MRSARPHLLASLAPLALFGCIKGSAIQTVPMSFASATTVETGETVEIDGLTPCTLDSMAPGELDPAAPIIVLVHGCGDSAGRFTTLAEVFAAHGQQAICFTYESRDTIEIGAHRLVRALANLEGHAPNQPITIIGHSQGGLVARQALSETLAGAPALASDYELVTISSPFAGIYAARHCSHNWLHGISLGITAAICRGVAGRNWTEIHPRAKPVRDPGELGPEVTHYIQVRTDERGTCRVERADGSCAKDDFVFSLDEQHNPRTLDAGVREVEVEAGHVAIVGQPGVVPELLVALLQAEGVMNPTPPDQREAINRLLRQLYLAESNEPGGREPVVRGAVVRRGMD
jgi:pimeloyl-ACP methyl ester carboxylesterase